MIALIQYVLLLGFRDRLYIALCIMLASIYGLSLFVGATSLIEQREMTLVFFAGSSRLLLMIGLSAGVIAMIRRAYDMREIEALFATSLSRTRCVIGLLLGHHLIAACMTVCVGIMLWLHPIHIHGLYYFLSTLMAEASIVITFSMLASLMLKSTATSLLATSGFYILSRLIGLILASLSAPYQSLLSWPDQIIRFLLTTTLSMFPRLDQLVQTRWLIYDISKDETLAPLLITSIMYSLLLLAVMILDVQRKEF